MTTPSLATGDQFPPFFEDLLVKSDEQLARYDIAQTNLLCAQGLPGKPEPDIPFCLRRVNEMAAATSHYTNRTVFDRRPQHWNHSWGIFRFHVLYSTLQSHFGVRYNPAKVPIDVPLDVPDSFLHGILQGEGGTCASLPVLYAAVGRRLGYPLKLVSAAAANGCGHLFLRWEEPGGERFNIDANNTGFDSPPDDYYRQDLYRVLPGWEETGTVLKSWTPREELAGFASQRAYCWGQLREKRLEAETLAWASALAPNNVIYLEALKRKVYFWHKHLEEHKPPNFPELYISGWTRRFPPSFPADIERNLLGCRITELLLNDPNHIRDWWEPMRQGLPMRRRPTRVDVECVPDGYRYVLGWSEIEWTEPDPGPDAWRKWR